MAQFGSITRAQAIERTAKTARGGADSEQMKPYMEAMAALFADIENAAGTLALGDDDKPTKERARLRAAYRKVLKREGMNLPRNGLVVKKAGSELVYYIDPNAPQREHKGGRPRKNPDAASVNGSGPVKSGAAPAVNGGGHSREPATVATGRTNVRAGKGDDIEL